MAGAALGAATWLQAASWVEDFSGDPLTQGWTAQGDPSLFRWDAAVGALDVTWDSGRTQTNSFFARPLGRSLTIAEDFQFGFDLRLEEIAVGTTPGMPYTFQLALGFVNLAEATQPGFLRGTGMDSPNLVEFDYFPDSGFGATVSPTIISTSGQFASGFTFPLELTPGDRFRVDMHYAAAARKLTTTMTRNGEPFGPVNDVQVELDFAGVDVDHVAVINYADAGQDPAFAGSVRARGWVDNLSVWLPDAPSLNMGGTLAGGRYTMTFGGTAGWRYTLQRTLNWAQWETIGEPVEGAGDRQILVDDDPPAGHAFYRLRAEKI